MYFCIQELFWDSDRKSRQLRLIFDIKKFYPKYQELLWSEWCSFVPIKEWETFWNICVWFTKCNFFTSMNGIQPFPHLESKTPESKGKFWLNLFSPFLSVLELSICSKIAEKLENQNQIKSYFGKLIIDIPSDTFSCNLHLVFWVKIWYEQVPTFFYLLTQFCKITLPVFH